MVPEISPGSTIVVEASVLNVGDATATAAQSNFVVPESIELTSLTADRPARFSHSRTSGQAPGHGVYFVAAKFVLPPGDWQLQRFQLRIPDDPGVDLRLLFLLSEGRFNVTGRRYLPSRLTDGDMPAAPFGTAWPPDGESIRWWHRAAWRRARAQPEGRLLCRRGVRADVRDLRVTDLTDRQVQP
jgi:hypothetical protein